MKGQKNVSPHGFQARVFPSVGIDRLLKSGWCWTVLCDNNLFVRLSNDKVRREKAGKLIKDMETQIENTIVVKKNKKNPQNITLILTPEKEVRIGC